ncbi:LysR family transcriptional regulator [Aquicoccus sp. G2-2]|uniref:LysR family transcriptional regulator n=1 Tax=Aquicoccus sp. G2-2 TaxID=3092120 RepID=UPI002ADFD582|nr:LysR family transcriptional regulator [Aquicoccus sp. G2-2]MEA1114206.1 LysR family transcriptional regulator [Aquicoccus sp. G2-2]
MAFNWNDLRYFLAIARTGRVTAAASRLGTDHATVSRRVASLEKRLQAKLFERSPRGYALTDTGERLLRHAERIETETARIQDDIGGEIYTLSGSVRIGTPDGFGSYFLTPWLADLALANPELHLQLVATPRVFSLSKREADIAIVLARPEKGRLFSRKLTDYTLHLYAHRDYLEAAPPITSKDDLAGHLLVGYIPDLIYTPELDYFAAVAGDLAPRLSSTNLFAQLRAADSGKGLAILPDFLTRHAPDLVPVLPELFEIRRSLWLVAHQDLRDSVRVRTVMSFIADQVVAARDEFLPDHLPKRAR